MSSFTRRIQRGLNPSRTVHWNEKTKGFESASARGRFYMGRGSKIGVTNLKCKCLRARVARDKKWGRK